MTSYSIVVIEDELSIGAAVAARLHSEGFDVDVAHDGPSGIELCRSRLPDLVILDIMLPGLDGLEVCRRIQAERHVPILMLTARDSETDLLVGLAVGADDYMTKPFSPRELVARVRAILRRVDQLRAVEPARLRVGDVEVDGASRRVWKKGDLVHLTPTEFDLLHRLVSRRQTVHTRDQLLADVWGYEDGSGPRTVDSHVAGVRRKLGDAVIRTVHGVGYAVGDGTP